MIDPRSTRVYKLEKEDRELKKEIELFKKRNEKAIERIENVRIYGLRSGRTLIATLLNDILDMLQGVDKE